MGPCFDYLHRIVEISVICLVLIFFSYLIILLLQKVMLQRGVIVVQAEGRLGSRGFPLKIASLQLKYFPVLAAFSVRRLYIAIYGGIVRCLNPFAATNSTSIFYNKRFVARNCFLSSDVIMLRSCFIFRLVQNLGQLRQLAFGFQANAAITTLI